LALAKSRLPSIYIVVFGLENGEILIVNKKMA
jgi:hypothetical protein